MSSQESLEIKEMIAALGLKIDTIAASLKTCQSRCHVDNPPRKLRGLLRAVAALVKF